MYRYFTKGTDPDVWFRVKENKVAGGEIFEASYTPGHNPEKPWEILDDKGNVLDCCYQR